MSERPFMQLYVSDFIGDTLHLTTEQIGAYMLTLMAMWNAGGKLPADEAKLARVARMSVKKWKAISGDLLAFFQEADGFISHNRLTKELQKSESKSQSRAAAGAEGGKAKALKDKEAHLANARVLPQHLPDTITRDTSSLRSDVPAQAPSQPTPRAELKSTLDDERTAAVIDHRKRIGKPLTPRAAQLLAGKFAKCADPNAAADAMIANGWQGFEPEWLDRRQQSHRQSQAPPISAHQQRHQTAIDACDRILGVKRDDEFTGNTLDLGNADWRAH